jgi:molybdate transport system permease protein
MSDAFWTPALLSLKVAVCSTGLVVVFGVLFGRLMARRRFRGRSVAETLLMLPMVMPPTVVGFGLLLLLGRSGLSGWLPPGETLLFSWYAAVIASAVVSFPLMYQAAKTGFEMVDDDLEAVAKVLGANGWQVFRYVALPLSWPALLSGVLLSFARGLGEFGATLMVAGNIPGRTQTLPLGIYSAVEAGETQLAWLWVILLFLLSFVFMWTIQRLQRKKPA